MVKTKTNLNSQYRDTDFVEVIAIGDNENMVALDKDDIIHWEVLKIKTGENPLEWEKVEPHNREILNAILKLGKKSPDKIRLFLGARKVKIAGTVKIRRMWGDALKSGAFEKIAMVGLSVYTRMAARLIMAYAKVKFVKFFNSRERALKWLRE